MYICTCGHRHTTFVGTFMGIGGRRYVEACPECPCVQFRSVQEAIKEVIDAPVGYAYWPEDSDSLVLEGSGADVERPGVSGYEKQVPPGVVQVVISFQRETIVVANQRGVDHPFREQCACGHDHTVEIKELERVYITILEKCPTCRLPPCLHYVRRG